jgi:hypothetical protein
MGYVLEKLINFSFGFVASLVAKQWSVLQMCDKKAVLRSEYPQVHREPVSGVAIPKL